MDANVDGASLGLKPILRMEGLNNSVPDSSLTEQLLVQSDTENTRRWNFIINAYKNKSRKISRYTLRKNFPTDVSLSLLMTAIIVPQSMAYATLAGLPTVFGLYTSMVPCLVYAILGSRIEISLGTFAIVSMLVASSLHSVGYHCNGNGEGLCPKHVPSNILTDTEISNTPAQYINASIAMSLLVGVVQFVCSQLQLSAFFPLLSDMLLRSFTSAASILIIISQIKTLSCLSTVCQNSVFQVIKALILEFHDIEWYNVSMGLFGVVFLILVDQINRKFLFLSRHRIPAQLLLVVISTLSVWHWELYKQPFNVKIVGFIDSSTLRPALPHFSSDWKPSAHFYPNTSMPLVYILIRPAIAIGIISSILSLATSKVIQLRMSSNSNNSTTNTTTTNAQHIHPMTRKIMNYELCIFGMANIVGSLFRSYPSSASLSRGAIIQDFTIHRAATMFTHALISLLIILVSQYLTQYFYFLPRAVLCSIVLVAIRKLVFFPTFRNSEYSMREISAYYGVLLFTLLTDIMDSIVLCFALSSANLLNKSVRPSITTQVITRNSTSLSQEQDCLAPFLLFTFHSELHYANVSYFEEQLRDHIERAKTNANVNASSRKPFTVLVDCQFISSIDSVSETQLGRIVDKLHQDGIVCHFISSTLEPLGELKSRIDGVCFQNGKDNNNKSLCFKSTSDAIEFVLESDNTQV